MLAWAATAVTLAAIADLTTERRLQISSLAYLALAAGHALVLDSPPSHFFEATRHPATGVPAVLIVVLAAAGVAYLLRAAKPRKQGDRLDRAIEERQERWRHVSIAVATILLVYAVSLSILGLAEEIGNGTPRPGSTAAMPRSAPSGACSAWSPSTSGSARASAGCRQSASDSSRSAWRRSSSTT